jgi:hypothetical protein
MPDRERELERELRELGSRIEYPPTPDLARAVRRRLDGEGAARPTRSRRFWSSLPSLRWAVAATAFLLIVAVPALSPTMRATVAGWFDAGQTASSEQAAKEADEVPEAESGGALAPSAGKDESPAESARPDSSGSSMAPSAGGPRPSGEELGFGNRISLREARTGEGGFFLPETLGRPDEIYAGEPPNEEGVTLVYRARAGLPPLGDAGIGLILTELPGDIESAYFPEGQRPEAGLQRVQVGGKPGYWVPAGRGVPSPIDRTGKRLHGSVLLWEQEGVALRLEADISEQEAIRIAGSVR